MTYPVPMGPFSMVLSSIGHGSLLSGVCSCSAVLVSMKFPALPKSIKAGSTEFMSKYLITVDMMIRAWEEIK